ncbi:hypothetical protein E5358_12730 [Palleniella muris]|uniref:Uncharacterized protein n=1 Tax=Palleniella muris TaxID=3038145 RepID=A0AC61QMN1_9BACT|nr:hypothetical protein [Palleniella muris]TGX80515.1 hypothetical protein E5358_12730 [Palleniella muris]
MKQCTIWVTGTAIITPVAFSLAWGSLWSVLFGLIYAFGVYLSGTTDKGRKFWRKWCKINLLITAKLEHHEEA